MAQAPNRPRGADYDPAALDGGLREWPLEAPVALRDVMAGLSPAWHGFKKPVSYRIYFDPLDKPHGSVTHMLEYGTEGWRIPPGDFADMVSVGLSQIGSDSRKGTVSFYFTMPETNGAMKAELAKFRRGGF